MFFLKQILTFIWDTVDNEISEYVRHIFEHSMLFPSGVFRIDGVQSNQKWNIAGVIQMIFEFPRIQPNGVLFAEDLHGDPENFCSDHVWDYGNVTVI